MCLILTSIAKSPQARGYGYKVYTKFAGRFQSEYYNRWGNSITKDQDSYEGCIHTPSRYKLGDKLTSKKGPGFHIFLTLEGAREWKSCNLAKQVIVKVRWTKRLSKGFQYTHPAITAENITLLEVIE